MFPRDPGDDARAGEGETARCRSRRVRARPASRFSTSSTARRSMSSQHVNLVVVAKAPLARVLTPSPTSAAGGG